MMDMQYMDLANEWGTPSFVFDLGEFRSRLKACQEIVGYDVNLCYCMKANPFLINAAAQTVHSLEVCSPGELALCERANIPAFQVVYSGVNKELTDIAEAISYGVGVLTAESLLHVDYINQVASEMGVVVDVLLRLNAGSQFGMSKTDLNWVVDNRERFANINLVGLHYFVYTQRKNLKHQTKELNKLVAYMDELREEHGFEVQRLEYGPGLGVPLFEDEDFSDTLAPLKELAPLLREVGQKVELTVEMGRFFATSCGVYMTSVRDQKSNKGTNYVILDGGMNHLSYFGQTMAMRVPQITNVSLEQRKADAATAEEVGAGKAATPSDETVKEWCLCGSLCTVNDVLVRSVELEDLQHNDVLVFRNAGAYTVTEGVYLFLSRTMPRVILVEADGRVLLARDFVESSQLNGMFA